MQSRESTIRTMLALGIARSRVPEPTEAAVTKLATGEVLPHHSNIVAGFVAQLSEAHPFAKIWAAPVAARLLDQQERFAGRPVESTREGFDYLVGRFAAGGAVDVLQQLIKIAAGRGLRGSMAERRVSRDAAARLLDLARINPRFSAVLLENGFDPFEPGQLSRFSQVSDTVLHREAIALRRPLVPPADIEPTLAGRPFTLDKTAADVRRRLNMLPAKKEE